MMTKHLSDSVSCSFWIPSSVDYLLEEYGNYLSEDELKEFYSNPNIRCENLRHVFEAVSNTHKKLEQEIYLHPKFHNEA